MTAAAYFSPSYAAAADRFVRDCAAAGATLEHHVHSRVRGPSGEQLSVDVACFGGADDNAVVLVVSGTHGIEGYAGAACQLALVHQAGPQLARSPGAVVLVHALNPWGFAHWRRVNEDNVDLNRNFVDHTGTHPDNALYAELHALLLPRVWSESELAAAERQLGEVVRRAGKRAVQAAITGGQYSHADGLFYGGRAPVWSNRVWEDVLQRHAAHARRIAVVDLHTGLGKRGEAEIILRAQLDEPGLQRARAWYGAGVTTSEDGTSSSTEIGGNTPCAVKRAAPHAEITAVTVELGTLPPRDVLEALRADHWIARQPASAVSDERCSAVRRQMVAAFCPEEREWRDAVVERGTAAIRGAWSGLFGTL
jgi:predicted deacylase